MHQCVIKKSTNPPFPICFSFRSFLLLQTIIIIFDVFKSGWGAYIPLDETLSITTFNSSTSIDSSTQRALGDSQTPANPEFQAITAVTSRIFPGQDDAAAGAGQTYWGFPPPTSFQSGQNTASEPQSGPCLGQPGSNCSAFLGAQGQAGPITIEYRASPVTLKYVLEDTGIRVPYCYLDHSTKLLWCKPNTGPEGQAQHCSYGPAQYVSYDNNLLLNPWRQDLGNDPDPTEICRGENNKKLGGYNIYNDDKNEDYVTPGCFACPISIDEEYGGRLATIPHFCPFHAGHPANPPTYQESAMDATCPNVGCRPDGPITADAAGLEPYYYFCYGMIVGYDSDLYYKDPNDANVYSGLDVSAGLYNDFDIEYETAYQCTLSRDIDDNCPPYKFVGQMLAAGASKCTVGDNQDPDCTGSGTTADCSLIKSCANAQTEEVTSAVRFLTGSCDAQDTQESRSGVSYGDPGSDPKGFKCPGDRWSHIRPQLIRPKEGYKLARCSAGCDNPNTVTNSRIPTKNTNREIKNYVVSSVMDEKATIELGPMDCRVYNVQTQPRASITLDVIITAPDGEQKIIKLGTEDLTFGVAEFGSANFSARINSLNTAQAGVGEEIDGYIVICGTDVNVDVNRGGTDVSGCSTLDSPEYNISNRETCDVNQGFFRGVFPQEDGSVNPNINPWPDLIRKMKSDYLERCADGSTPSQDCSSETADAKEASCAVPTPMYTSTLNCGRPTYWYFVPRSRVGDYGSDCGQLGFRNAFAATNGGAQYMCQQGSDTCTPGFGTPRQGTNAASTAARSPCQELGALNGFQYDTQDLEGGCKNINVELPNNLPPGWRYAGEQEYTTGDYEPQNQGNTNVLTSGVPNIWPHGQNLYRQPTASESAQMSLSVQVYTNTFFGGEFVSCAGGTINNTDLLYCQTTVSEANSGSVAVEFCNTNPSAGGRYQASTTCYLPESIVSFDNLFNLTISTDPPIEFDLGPGECKFESWGFEVSGTIQVTQVYCTTTLFAGGPCSTFGAIAETEYDCDVKVASFTEIGKRNVITTIEQFNCLPMEFFCWLSEQNPWIRALIYVLLLAAFILIVFLTFIVAYVIYYQCKADKALENAAEDNMRAAVARKLKEQRDLKKFIQRTVNKS